MSKTMLALSVVVAGLSASSISNAAMIEDGLYQLHNHPDGAAAAPFYGMRLDELYNVTSGHDIFTFDFDHADSDMQMTISGSVIHIFGVVFGGRDTGSSYANDAYRGIYTIDFTLDQGVMQVPGDDDVWVNTTNNVNTGSIMTPLGDEIALEDERGSYGYSLRLGDENNDLGHRGFNGISGWGWMN
ncbi:MAG: hypothetical protein KDA21_06440, partial [Phycisphaerales bacterium]|nr:hypothetical protein [Phycisphaerales bacterium]